jgi:hypothetical protein
MRTETAKLGSRFCSKRFPIAERAVALQGGAKGMPELTPSTREAARRLGVSDTALRKAEQTNRIAREPDGQWDIDKTRRRLTETADPARSPLASNAGAEGTPFARLKVAQLALKVEAQRLSLDETKRRLLDVTEANAALDEIGSTMRDALLNWPARVGVRFGNEAGAYSNHNRHVFDAPNFELRQAGSNIAIPFLNQTSGSAIIARNMRMEACSPLAARHTAGAQDCEYDIAWTNTYLVGIDYTATANRCGNAVINRHRAPASRFQRFLAGVPNTRAAAFRQSATEVGVEGLITIATSTTTATFMADFCFNGLTDLTPTDRAVTLAATQPNCSHRTRGSRTRSGSRAVSDSANANAGLPVQGCSSRQAMRIRRKTRLWLRRGRPADRLARFSKAVTRR